MRNIDTLVIHCSATRPEWMDGATVCAQRDEIRRWHIEQRGWRDIGYHGVIGRNGEFVCGRPFEQIGAHVIGHNRTSIGVCLIGGHGSAANDAPLQHYTFVQLWALRGFVTRVRGLYPGIIVAGHNQFAAKGCPGFNVKEFFHAS